MYNFYLQKRFSVVPTFMNVHVSNPWAHKSPTLNFSMSWSAKVGGAGGWGMRKKERDNENL